MSLMQPPLLITQVKAHEIIPFVEKWVVDLAKERAACNAKETKTPDEAYNKTKYSEQLYMMEGYVITLLWQLNQDPEKEIELSTDELNWLGLAKGIKPASQEDSSKETA